MQDDKSSSWLTLAMITVFVAEAVFGAVTFHNTDVVRETERRIAKSYQIREATQQLLSSMKDMETGQRGFLMTGREEYLDPYHQGLREVEEGFSNLRQLERGSPQQQLQLERLQDLNDDKKAYLAESIDLRRETTEPVISAELRRLVLSGRGREKMAETRTIVRDVLQEQDRQLAEQESVSNERAASSKLLIVVGNFLTLTLIVVAGIVAHVDRQRRDVAEAEILAKQSELGSIIDSSRDGIVTFGKDLRIRLVNPAAAMIYRANASDMVGQNVATLCSNTQSNCSERILAFLDSDAQSTFTSEAVGLRKDGEEFPFAGTMTKTVANDEFVTWILHDLSESKASEAKLREQAAILNQVRDAILVCDMGGRILFWNAGAESLFGFTAIEAINRNVVDLLYADNLEFWERGQLPLAQFGAYTAEVTLVNRRKESMIIEHRRSLICDDNGDPYAQLILNIDVTERKSAESRNRRTQRLISIGTLSGGIAHDLNNVLTPILMSAKLLQRNQSNYQRLTETIVKSAERGSEMVRKLLAFAGGEDGPREQIDFSDVVSEVAAILTHTLPKAIDLNIQTGQELPIIGNATELSQVVMNLAINARDAMPHGGRIDLVTQRFFVDHTWAERSGVLVSGPHVLLEVCDQGQGIADEILDQIFDPFFTTKEQGKGTGLGLATSLGIVRSHGGDITVQSTTGVSTKFSLYLPCAVPEISAPETSVDIALAPGAGESILVVDDEELILETSAETLRTSGYRVRVASSGQEAISLCQQERAGFDLVIVDMMMPGIDGQQTKNALRQILPDARIVASSGLRRPGSETGLLDEFDAFLAKPYSDTQLLDTIQTTLDKPRGQR